MKNIIFILVFFSILASYSQDTTYARQVIKKLTSKELLGRGYINDGVNKAASYISKEMKGIGLSKFGKSYSQFYSFPVNTFPGKISVVLDGRILVSGKHFLIEPSATTIKQGFQLFKTDSVTYEANDGRRPFPLKVKLKKKLTYTVATELSDVTTIELLKDSFPNELKNIDVIFENKFITNFKCQNLCGYIKGTQHPDSFIVFTAHYDHLGAMGTEAFFPGANDNASGVSVLLNLAKYYKTHPLKYSVAFIFFSGEEAGLLGSKYYSEHPLFPLSKIKFLTNLDLLGTGDDGIMVVNATVFKERFEKLKSINDTKNYLKQVKQRGKAANSDHYWFTEKGVPSFFIYTMGGITSYHDIYDIEKTLPLTKYLEVCKLLIEFNGMF
ncbi:MAG TPA: M28 family peptidase [Bacteroidia bacterium]|nr:M28 family peptidase [Bacteroidia bacterium]